MFFCFCQARLLKFKKYLNVMSKVAVKTKATMLSVSHCDFTGYRISFKNLFYGKNDIFC